MMGVLSFVFEGALAVLMALVIVYCVRLNRGLSAIRASDTQINELIARLIEASDRAEASVAQLKAVGVEQERALRAAIEDAESVSARLSPESSRGFGVAAARDAGAITDVVDVKLPEGVAASLESLTQNSGAAPEARQGERQETEQALLAAIRHARAAG